jgi:hypothetical protein
VIFGLKLLGLLWQDLIMLEWKEREHEVNDQAALGDRATMVSLRNCGLLKFFVSQLASAATAAAADGGNVGARLSEFFGQGPTIRHRD